MSSPASLQFSTRDVAPHQRIAAWREAYGPITRLEFEPVSEGPLTIEATLSTFPGLGIASMNTDGLRFSKPSSLIDSDDLILVIMESGGYQGSQFGREVQLQPGDAVIRWNAEIATGQIHGRPSIIRVPTKAIELMVGDVSTGVQRRIPAETDALRLLRPYTQTMQRYATTPALQHIVTSQVYDLFALLLGATREATEVARGRGVRAARLKAIKADIAARLSDPTLGVADIARRHKLSPRYVHRLFEEDGASLGEFVLGLRLARAERMLVDPRHADRSISTIGYEVGFGDLSYFYRSFRRRFGATPSNLRATALAELPAIRH